jgi:CRISPR-associated endonuclease/helicase Cas3
MPEFLQQLITENHENKITLIEPDPTKLLDNEVITKKRHMLEIWQGDILENIDGFIEKFSGKKLLIICNHVPTAQSVYKYIVTGIEEGRYEIDLPTLIHSRFTQRDRSNIEDLILSEQPKILIATQVVEVSLNLDYNVCITEPAPIDALIQRFGRVNRYGIRNPEPVIVCRKQVNKYPIYPELIVKKTLQYMELLQGTFLTETNLIEAGDMVYADGYDKAESEEFERALNYPELKDFDENTIAGIYRNWIEDVIEGTDQSIEVLPRKYYKEYIDLRKNKQWIEADMLLVPIRINQFGMFLSKGYIERIQQEDGVFTITAPYDPLIGLQTTSLEPKMDGNAVFI